MVEYQSHSQSQLDLTFSSLSDPTRRDILRRIQKKELTVSEIAKSYEMSLAAISKHLMVLEKAKLIEKHRKGRQQFIALSPPALKDASEYLKRYKDLWERRLDRLEELLKEK
jgi:DNA-binding transcriptional ArsR family regulator